MPDDVSSARYSAEALRRFVAGVLEALGVMPADAAIGAEVLIDADLTGVDTHGIANFPRHLHYAKGLESGAVDPRPDIGVLRDSPVAAAWDSGKGFGPIVARRAMTEAIAKAERSGVGMVSVRNGRHFGANGYFAEMAARAGHMGMVAATTMPSAFPPGGRRPVVGTNPFAFAAPRGDGPPLVVDIAMTATSGTRVMEARQSGRPIPEGWAVDADGQPTTDPSVVGNGGGLLPLGGLVAGHKGYGLALMVDALAILAGSGSGLWQRYTPEWAQGQWFAAWRVDLFLDPEEFRAEMQRVADHIHDEPGTDGPVLIPGERRAACRVERSSSGIPLPRALVAELEDLGGRTGVAFPAPG